MAEVELQPFQTSTNLWNNMRTIQRVCLEEPELLLRGLKFQV
jgi:hypothetical protein